ncbi:MAG: UDP-N-acetylmuramate dehydrogenase [Balneolaceae bacterium]|nr:UDP-N-acetylmuramate dehydrogenase [Balneolaceae bacterium]
MTDLSYPELKKNHSLKAYNTLGVEARASRFASIESEEQLTGFLAGPGQGGGDLFVLGGGSNVLFVGNYEGTVLHIAIEGIEVVREDTDHVWIRAGAGENWHRTVQYCVKQGWGGIENLSLIPGTVGAAPIQNIGAYGVELREVFDSLSAIHIESAEKRFFDRQACRFGYRDSIFKNELKGEYIITTVTLRLSKVPELNTSYGAIRSKLLEKGIDRPTVRDISDVVIEIRNSKLPNPNDLGNAGSFFKNPMIKRERYEELKRRYPEIPGYPSEDGEQVKVPAGWLIEETGWKGKRVGNTGTYRQQALVIVNHGGATGAEIFQLAEQIRNSVRETFGIDLVPEVNIIG